MYLFDTDAITNLLKKRPSPAFIHRLKELKPEKQFITSITIAEIVYGAKKSDRPEHHLENLEKILLPMVTVLDFDLRAGYIAGHHRATFEKLGTPLAWPDLQIAAIAITHQMILVTGNIRHFSRIPELRVENWIGS